jgi:GWxTD domain-containing protein
MIILFLIISNQGYGQFRTDIDKANLYNLGKKFYTETHYFPSLVKDSTEAMVFFRFSYDMITFEKYGLASNVINKFFSIPKIEIEFKDKEGIIRNKEIWQDTIFVDNFEKTISGSDYIVGAISSRILTNNYDVDIRLTDKSNLTIKKVTHKDSLENFFSKPTIGKPVFVELSDNDNQKFIPFILRNKISFLSRNPLIIIPVSYKNEFSKFNYSCKFIGQNKKYEFKWKTDYNVNSVIVPAKNHRIKISDNNINLVELAFESMEDRDIKNGVKSQGNLKDDDLNYGLININLPIDDLVPGEYELKVVEDKSNDTMKYSFEVLWEEMPMSLQKPKFALESMYYILKDDEYKKMQDAREDDYSFEIWKWWKKEDPTPATVYNESMAEYFKRVDYALFNLKSMSEPNGVKSDRGKIYILYGPPSGNERRLSDNKAYEVWRYDHLKKMFIFETLSNDIYKLVEIKNY